MASGAQTPAAAPAASPPGQQRTLSLGSRILRAFLYQRELAPALITIGVFLYFWAKAGTGTFLNSLSLSSAAGFAGPVGAIAVGEVLLLVLAEIDLSAGQVFLFAPWVMYWMVTSNVPLALSILIALAVCGGVGLVNGLITTLLNVPSFVSTLAMNFILFGAVLIASNETQASPIPLNTSAPDGTGFAGQFMGNYLWSEFLWLIAITIVVTVVFTRTRFGVRIVATGGNLLGAAEAGVPTRRVKVWCFALCSFLSGMMGIVDAVKYGSLDPGNAGVDYILYAVGACVIGGTALTGGRGTVIGAFIGAILIGLLNEGFTLIGLSIDQFYVAIGVVIIFAMALNVQFDRLIARSRAR